jgi:two-component system, OmpR family, sensor histidine kinase CssS
MKNVPLSMQIAIVFTGLIFFICTTVLILVPGTLSRFFINDIYTTISYSQKNSEWRLGSLDKIEKSEVKQDVKSVNHLFIGENGNFIKGSYLPISVIKQMYNQALDQPTEQARYETSINNEKIFYIILKRELKNKTIYQVSYMWDSYRQELVHNLFKHILVITIFVLIIGILLALFFSKWLSKPIIQMKQHVLKIANRNWNEPLILDRKDEFGSLALSIERMRKQLVDQDQAQQTMLQHVSHDLKTPVMIIRSYAQAMRDGVFPKGSLEKSLDVIDDESKRLEAKIKDLLFLTKLDYLAHAEKPHHPFSLSGLIEEEVLRLQGQRDEITINLHLPPCEIKGDVDQWKAVIENIVDNALRFAATTINLKLEKNSHCVILEIWNDGPLLDEVEKKTIFQPFIKGKNGKFGLGLYIVKRIMDMHNVKIGVNNKDNGVSFVFDIPK